MDPKYFGWEIVGGKSKGKQSAKAKGVGHGGGITTSGS